MLRLLIATVVSSGFLFSAQILSEEQISTFLKNSLSSDKTYSLKKVTLHFAKNINYPKEWSAYFVTLNFEVRDKEVELKEVVFSDGFFIVKDFATVKDGKSLKSKLLENWDKNIKGDR